MRKKLPIEKIKELPKTPGVYFLKNKNGEVFYVGKAINIKSRIYSHKQREEVFRPEKISTIEWIATSNEIEALLKESEYIKRLQPRMNTRLRDDKQYFYVGITKEEFPRIFVTHQPDLSEKSQITKHKVQTNHKTQITNSKKQPITYLGPYTDGKALKATMKHLRKLFPYYQTNYKRPYASKKHGNLPCSYCHLGLCPGPNPSKDEYKKNIRAIKNVLKGRRSSVVKDLQKEMREASKQDNYEKAAEIRDTINAIENIFSHQFALAWAPPANTATEYEAGKKLAEIIGVENPINSIEGYDISNIQGKEPTASMVRFDGEKPNKSLYRKFNILSPDEPNDYLMMREVIRRRFKHAEWPFPDLILIDGGRGQLNAALAELSSLKIDIPAISLSKAKSEARNQGKTLSMREEEIYLPKKQEPVPLSDMPKSTENLLKHVRDEAHRFAISHHRARHRKQSLS